VHPRSAELSSRLLPWLEDLGLGEQIEEFHREILESAHGQLPPDQRTEAYWRGESAAVLGWSVRILDKPDLESPVDPGHLADGLKLLRPQADDLLNEATLRSRQEIDEFCAFCLAVRSQCHQSTASEEVARTLDAICRKRMRELALHDIDR